MKQNDETKVFEVDVHNETEKAYQVSIAGERERFWVPKSQCDVTVRGMLEYLSIPIWLAEEKGLL